MLLVQYLGYYGMTESGDRILEGVETLETKGNQYTRQLLHQLRSPTNKPQEERHQYHMKTTQRK